MPDLGRSPVQLRMLGRRRKNQKQALGGSSTRLREAGGEGQIGETEFEVDNGSKEPKMADGVRTKLSLGPRVEKGNQPVPSKKTRAPVPDARRRQGEFDEMRLGLQQGHLWSRGLKRIGPPKLGHLDHLGRNTRGFKAAQVPEGQERARRSA